MLKNVSELLLMGEHNEEVDRIFMLLPRTPQLAPPPPTSSSYQAKREPSRANTVATPSSSASSALVADEGLEIGVEATESKLSELMMSNTKLEANTVVDNKSRTVIKSPLK